MGRLFGDFCFDDDDDDAADDGDDDEVDWGRPLDMVQEIMVRDVLCGEPADWEAHWMSYQAGEQV